MEEAQKADLIESYMAEKLELDKEQWDAMQKKYVKGKGRRCPFCNSKHIDTGEIETEGEVAYGEIFCTTCEKSWVDEYRLIGFNLPD